MINTEETMSEEQPESSVRLSQPQCHKEPLFMALAQTEILWEDKRTNLQKAECFAKEAHENDAQIIFFPEMSFTGFSMHTQTTGDREHETVKVICHMAKTIGIAIGFGWVELGGDRAKNHYTVVDATGNVLSDYIKIHPFSYSDEDNYFAPGNKLTHFSFNGLNIGTLICYDLRFPEPFQILAEDCDIIVVAANWPQKRSSHWKTLLQARAIECQCYILGINCCGMQQDLAYSGDSCLFAPDGTLIGGFQEKEGLLYAEIPANVDDYRHSFPTRDDRNWELYWEWYTQKVEHFN